MRITKIIIIIFSFFFFKSHSQSSFQQELGIYFNSTIGLDTGFTSDRSMFNPFAKDSTYLKEFDNNLWEDKKYIGWFFNKNWIGYEKQPNKYFTLNPYYNIQTGRENFPENQSLLQYRRGVLVSGKFGDRFRFFSILSENVSNLDSYTMQMISETKVSPGEGEVKLSNNQSFSVIQSFGMMEARLTDEITLTAGHGKNFFGDGYRSLLLSDNATNYPMAKLNFKFWCFNYSATAAEFIDLYSDIPGDGLRQKSYGTFHYLDIKLHERWYVGLMEAVIYKGDSLGRFSFDMNYLNPFVVMRPQEMNLGSPDNMLMGANAKILLTDAWKIYGQAIITEFKGDELFGGQNWWGNKYGFQAGTRFNNPKILPGFNARLEYNIVRPFTYAHRSSAQAYGHLNQALAHPLGSNFQEFLTHLNYQKNRWLFSLNINYNQKGNDYSDSPISYGGNIFINYNMRDEDYGHTTLQGNLTTQLITDAKVSWLINPANFMFAELGFTQRNIWQNNSHQNFQYFFIGVKTKFLNYYNDY